MDIFVLYAYSLMSYTSVIVYSHCHYTSVDSTVHTDRYHLSSYTSVTVDRLYYTYLSTRSSTRLYSITYIYIMYYTHTSEKYVLLRGVVQLES